MSERKPAYPVTRDGRYFVVRDRLWRWSNPRLDAAERERLTHELMAARREIARIKRTGDGDMTAARAAVDRAKLALGGARAGLVDRWRARLQPAHGAQYALC